MRPDARRAQHRRLLEHESVLWEAGAALVAGLDEAGAGPWAGPVVAACVVLDPARTDPLLGVNDSKKLSEKARDRLAPLIRAHATAWAVAEAAVEEIDRLNIRAAGLLAMSRALEAVLAATGRLDHLLVDARTLAGTAVPQTSLIRGDSRSLSIAAASILAKVHRDGVMTRLSADYPHHGFEMHKGYGTRAHQEALHRHGVTPIHRRSFAPIRELLAETDGRAGSRQDRRDQASDLGPRASGLGLVELRAFLKSEA